MHSEVWFDGIDSLMNSQSIAVNEKEASMTQNNMNIINGYHVHMYTLSHDQIVTMPFHRTQVLSFPRDA